MDLLPQHKQVYHEQMKIGQQVVDSYITLNSLSVLDKIKGTKNTDNGQLYALMFTCGPCNHKAIRTFTKQAYHNGVVLIRCQNCQNVHLIADNLNWFGQQKINLDQLSNGQVKKVHDAAAVRKFLQTAFGQHQHGPNCNHHHHQHGPNCSHHHHQHGPNCSQGEQKLNNQNKCQNSKQGQCCGKCKNH